MFDKTPLPCNKKTNFKYMQETCDVNLIFEMVLYEKAVKLLRKCRVDDRHLVFHKLISIIYENT